LISHNGKNRQGQVIPNAEQDFRLTEAHKRPGGYMQRNALLLSSDSNDSQ
jgi:hypothetical protein